MSKAGANGFCPGPIFPHQLYETVTHFAANSAIDQFLLDTAEFGKVREDGSRPERNQQDPPRNRARCESIRLYYGEPQ
jgi:hypothetical protein